MEGSIDSGPARARHTPSRKPCRFFHQNDCYRGDKCHMVHAPKEETHQFWLADPWSRPPCEWEEKCPRTHAAHTGPTDPELLRTNIALQTENSQLARVRAYAAGVLGAGGKASDTGVARSGTSRFKQKLALLEAKDARAFSRECVSDPSLCRSVLRVYILGGGVCSSLEDVGRQLSAEVAAGKHVEHPEGATAGPIAPVRVRVQALPKVMERQLVDEESNYWDTHFRGLVRERRAGVFTHVLSVIFVRGAFLYGIAPAHTHGRCLLDNNNDKSAVSRAFYKLKEASARAEISFGESWTAIDIGSAPGGWTSYLAARCQRVLSVDPAELDPEVLAHPHVVHIQQTIEAAHDTLRALLLAASPGRQAALARDAGNASSDRRSNASSREDGIAESSEEASALVTPDGCDAETRAAEGAEVLVSDMNAEPRVVADVLLSCMRAGLARPGALIIATFKDFCGRTKKMRDEVDLAIRRLEAGCGAGVCAHGGAQVPSRRVEAEVEDERVESLSGVDVGSNVVVDALPRDRPLQAAGPATWKLAGVKTMKLLAGGQAEVTMVARTVRGETVQ